jgi:radical SAM protein with 4Fe4S-binding SPASM domain
MKKLNSSHIGNIFYTDLKAKIKKKFFLEGILSKYRKEKKFLLQLLNKLLKREYILPVLNRINIETTSICNLKCGFCAYDKRDLNSHPRTTMSRELFQRSITEASKLGYKRIGLTPTTGDAFMDKGFIEKLEVIEADDIIDSCYFYTNFIPCSESQIESLFSFKKFFLLAISIYGNDEESFCKFTKGNSVGYKKLVSNLNFLSNLLDSKKLHFEIRINQRCKEGFYLSEDNNELSRAIKNLAKKDKVAISHTYTHIYDNWGGKVSQEDVKDFGVDLKEGHFRKLGPCTMIFSRLNIGANGTVNACHVRDADYTLKIGNIKEKSLKEILSSKNEKYLEIINAHKSGNLPKVCKSCDVYSSIYEYPGRSDYVFAKAYGDQSINFKEFGAMIDQRKKEIEMKNNV